jgi:hypothetical protein
MLENTTEANIKKDHVGYKSVRQVFNAELELLLVDYIKAAQI